MASFIKTIPLIHTIILIKRILKKRKKKKDVYMPKLTVFDKRLHWNYELQQNIQIVLFFNWLNISKLMSENEDPENRIYLLMFTTNK